MSFWDIFGVSVKGSGIDDYFDKTGTKDDRDGSFWSAKHSNDSGWDTTRDEVDGWINHHEHHNDGDKKITKGWDYNLKPGEQRKRPTKEKKSKKPNSVKNTSGDVCYIVTATLIMDGLLYGSIVTITAPHSHKTSD